MERFPEKLKLARVRADLYQSQLSELVGVSLRSINDYENGRAIPRKKTMRKLASALGVTVEYLTNDAVDDPEDHYHIEARINATHELYGARAGEEMRELLQRNTAFLAGGEIDQETKDAFFDAIMEAYVACKKEARARFTPDSAHKQD